MADALLPHVPTFLSCWAVVPVWYCSIRVLVPRPLFLTGTQASESWDFSGAIVTKRSRSLCDWIPVLVLEEAVRQYLLTKHTHYLFFSWLDYSLYFLWTFEKTWRTESEVHTSCMVWGRKAAYFSPLKDIDLCLIHWAGGWAHDFLILVVFNFLFTLENFVHIYNKICSHLLPIFYVFPYILL